MIISTTSIIEGKQIIEYKGVVFAETMVFREFGSKYSEEVAKSNKKAMSLISEKASELGANAIIGLRIDYELGTTIVNEKMVIAYGTAVYCE